MLPACVTARVLPACVSSVVLPECSPRACPAWFRPSAPRVRVSSVVPPECSLRACVQRGSGVPKQQGMNRVWNWKALSLTECSPRACVQCGSDGRRQVGAVYRGAQRGHMIGPGHTATL